MKYYIYSIKTDKKDVQQYAAVEDPDLFAQYHYDPKIMKYTGISVEAPEPTDAIRIFHNPTMPGGEIFMEDEPQSIVDKRIIYESYKKVDQLIQEKMQRLAVSEQSTAIAHKLKEIHELMCQVVDIIGDKYNSSLVDKDLLYKTFQKYIYSSVTKMYNYQQLNDGDTEKS